MSSGFVLSAHQVDNYGWHNDRGEKVWLMLHKRRIKPCWDNGVERSEEDKERTWTRGPISDEHISFAQIWPTQRQRVPEPPENEKFQIIWRSNQNWNWDSPLTATCVSTRRGLSIEAIPNDWVVDTGRSTPALGADDHIWASSCRGLLWFYNYYAPAGMDCVGLLRW